MSLAPSERRRYVRHILLPEVRAEGQERLLGAHFSTDGSPSHDVAALYLTRAGLSQSSSGAPLPAATPHDPLDAALAGAWLAVEEIKRVLGVGVRADLDGWRADHTPRSTSKSGPST